MHSSTIK